MAGEPNSRHYRRYYAHFSPKLARQASRRSRRRRPDDPITKSRGRASTRARVYLVGGWGRGGCKKIQLSAVPIPRSCEKKVEPAKRKGKCHCTLFFSVRLHGLNNPFGLGGKKIYITKKKQHVIPKKEQNTL